MSDSAETAVRLAAAYVAECRDQLNAKLEKIHHCAGQLTDEQIWWRPHASANAVGNVILHLCGNIRQWILHGIGGAPDVRHRPEEFSQRDPIPKDILLQQLEETLEEAFAVLSAVEAEDLLRPRRIQGFQVSGLAAIFDSVGHFVGHTQEIIYITRLQLGDAYQFHWQPATKEEGAG